MNLTWLQRRPGETWEAWQERVEEVRVTRSDVVTDEKYIPGWGWHSSE